MEDGRGLYSTIRRGVEKHFRNCGNCAEFEGVNGFGWCTLGNALLANAGIMGSVCVRTDAVAVRCSRFRICNEMKEEMQQAARKAYENFLDGRE